MKNFSVEPFNVYDRGWAVLAAGPKDDFNCMTISWGGLGTLWSRPVATVYVKKNRYTYKFMEENEYFTVGFFDGENRKDLGILGSRSGRDGDKVALTSLTIEECGGTVRFREAKRTLLCRKIYSQDLDLDSIPPEVKERTYMNEPVHCMYVGEVIDVIE